MSISKWPQLVAGAMVVPSGLRGSAKPPIGSFPLYFVELNLIQSAFIRRYPMMSVLRKDEVRDREAVCGS